LPASRVTVEIPAEEISVEQIGPRPTQRYPWGAKATPYEEIGGDQRVRSLVEKFYDIVEAESPVLTAMLPSDTSGSRQKLYEFLSGWMGGPQLYFERRGHPRLRLRHMPFPIDTHAAEEWTRCMRQALSAVEAPLDLALYLERELGNTARGLRNKAE
jgi:hemoglobin